MQTNILAIGDRIELYHCKRNLATVSKPNVYISQLLDLIGVNKASIAMPIMGSRVIILDLGEIYMLNFFSKRGLYRCKAKVIERSRSNNMYIATVEFVSDLEKNQRRQYFRLPCVLDCKYRIVTDSDTIQSRLNQVNSRKGIEKVKTEGNTSSEQEITANESPEKEVWENGVITDISGGGIHFNSVQTLKDVDHIVVSFSISLASGKKVFDVLASTIESKPIVNRNSSFEHRIEFQDLSKEDRELLVKHIFEEDRKQRRKEKGL